MKKLTINEIAEMVGVSKTTISFYLNGKTNKMSDETQKKIQQVIEETGYTPSAATRTVKASDDCIGVILGDVSKPFAAKALKGIEEEAHEAGYQVIVGSNEMSFAKEKEYVEHMLKMGVSGFIIQATYRFGILAMELEKKNKKVVYLDIPPYDSQGVRVLGDNYQCVYEDVYKRQAYNSEPFPSERDGMYPITENVEWTTGFWTGLIWMMYDWSREECFKAVSYTHLDVYKRQALETAVILAEWRLYHAFGRTIRRPLLLSLCANSFSYGAGLILQMI